MHLRGIATTSVLQTKEVLYINSSHGISSSNSHQALPRFWFYPEWLYLQVVRQYQLSDYKVIWNFNELKLSESPLLFTASRFPSLLNTKKTGFVITINGIIRTVAVLLRANQNGFDGHFQGK